MSDMRKDARQKAGRKYSVDATGITSLEKVFVVVLNDVMSANGEALTFAGVPEIGSVHPSYDNLFVTDYDVQEGTGADKNTLTVTVKYQRQEIQTEETPGESDAVSAQVEEWGWDDGTDERELMYGVDGKAVGNSAGDPFENVPKVSTPAPVFTKVMNFENRQAGWAACSCCVNAGEMTIGGRGFAPGTLLCTVSERLVIGNPKWKYKYTVRLRYKSNKVKVGGTDSVQDIGWDSAVVDAGMREIDENDTEPKMIRVMDKETGKACVVTSATLLDGEGHRLSPGADPYVFRYQAYERANFPDWFTSEPANIKEGK